MLKLIKHEILQTKFLMLAYIIGYAVMFLAAFVLGSQMYETGGYNPGVTIGYGLSIMAFVIIAFGGALLMWLQPLVKYSGEISQKTGYMLFMTPNSVYKIMGVKLLLGALTAFISSLLFAVGFPTAVAVSQGESARMLFYEVFYFMELANAGQVILSAAAFLIACLCSYVLIFYLITMFTVLMPRTRWRFFIVYIVYQTVTGIATVLTMIFMAVDQTVRNGSGMFADIPEYSAAPFWGMSTVSSIFIIILYAGVTVGLYFWTVRLIKRKLNM
ncbi:MAG: hypothetical protein LBR54_02130 [Oscillospiraceae bacterium]|nr:hypothetical protein [Oscillospiraceae bacterium]